MNKTADFSGQMDAQTETVDPCNVLGTMYYLCCQDEQGKEVSRQPIDGEEYIRTVCPVCGDGHKMELIRFCEIVAAGEFCFYGTAIYCDSCAAKERARD